MADRYQDRPFPSADQARGESDPLAELARLIGQNDPLGAAAKPAPRPLQSRANVRPQQYDPPEEEPDAPSEPADMDAARAPRNPAAAAAPLPQEYDDEPEYEPAPVHPLHRYAAQPPQYAAQRRSTQPEQHAGACSRTMTRPQQQYADEPQQDPSRYDDALYGRLETGEHDYQRDPAYPDDPYAYQGEYEEEPAPKKRSSGLMTVAAVLALAVVGTGAAFAYRTFVGSPRSGEPPIIRADNSPTKVVPAPSDAARQDPRPHAAGRWRREAGVARRDAGRRQFEVRRAARGVSAAEPERQPAAGLRVYLRRRRCLRPPTARCRTTSRAGSGRSPSRATPPTTAAFRQAPVRRRRGQRRRRDTPLPRPPLPLPRRRVTRRRPMPAPIRRCRSRRRHPNRSRRPAWLRLTRRKPRRLELPRVAAVFWYR